MSEYRSEVMVPLPLLALAVAVFLEQIDSLALATMLPVMSVLWRRHGDHRDLRAMGAASRSIGSTRLQSVRF